MKTVKQFIFTIILFLSSNPTWAYDFTTVQGENTFFFTITSNTNPYTVKVVSENQSEPYYTDTATTPRGHLNIPSTVSHNGITYTVTAIGDYAFHYCFDITSLTIPNTIQSIGICAFLRCIGLKNISIPNSVTDIQEGAFASCINVNYLTLPNGIDSIKSAAFSDLASLAALSIPSSVTYIGRSAFEGLKFTNLVIPNTVIKIDTHAFQGGYFTSVTLGTAVDYVGYGAFFSCYDLYQFTCKSKTPPYIDPTAFGWDDYLTTLFVPCNAKAAYESADVWKDFSKIKEKFLHAIVVNSNNTAWGTVSNSTPNCTDTFSTLSATPKTGYVFMQWNDDNTDNPRTVNLTQDTSFTAIFALNDAIEDIDMFKNLKIYPNPTTNQLYIDFNQHIIKEIHIYDILGKDVLHLLINNSIINLNTETWGNGMYFIKIISENGSTIKLVRKE